MLKELWKAANDWSKMTPSKRMGVIMFVLIGILGYLSFTAETRRQKSIDAMEKTHQEDLKKIKDEYIRSITDCGSEKIKMANEFSKSYNDVIERTNQKIEKINKKIENKLSYEKD